MNTESNQPTKSRYDWSNTPKWVMHKATDEDGGIWNYAEKPVKYKGDNYWTNGDNINPKFSGHPGHRCPDWQNSLEARPTDFSGGAPTGRPADGQEPSKAGEATDAFLKSSPHAAEPPSSAPESNPQAAASPVLPAKLDAKQDAGTVEQGEEKCPECGSIDIQSDSRGDEPWTKNDVFCGRCHHLFKLPTPPVHAAPNPVVTKAESVKLSAAAHKVMGAQKAGKENAEWVIDPWNAQIMSGPCVKEFIRVIAADPAERTIHEQAERIKDLEAALKDSIKEEKELRAWKISALIVMRGICLQDIGKAMGLPLGSDIGPEILPFIETLKAERNAYSTELAHLRQLVQTYLFLLRRTGARLEPVLISLESAASDKPSTGEQK